VNNPSPEPKGSDDISPEGGADPKVEELFSTAKEHLPGVNRTIVREIAFLNVMVLVQGKSIKKISSCNYLTILASCSSGAIHAAGPLLRRV